MSRMNGAPAALQPLLGPLTEGSLGTGTSEDLQCAPETALRLSGSTAYLPEHPPRGWLQ